MATNIRSIKTGGILDSFPTYTNIGTYINMPYMIYTYYTKQGTFVKKSDFICIVQQNSRILGVTNELDKEIVTSATPAIGSISFKVIVEGSNLAIYVKSNTGININPNNSNVAYNY